MNSEPSSHHMAFILDDVFLIPNGSKSNKIFENNITF